MSASLELPVPPPGTVDRLIGLLRALPSDAQVLDWELARDDTGYVRLATTVIFAAPEQWLRRPG